MPCQKQMFPPHKQYEGGAGENFSGRNLALRGVCDSSYCSNILNYVSAIVMERFSCE